MWNLLAKSNGASAERGMELATIDLERNGVIILEAATGSSIPAKGCIIGVRFDRLALMVRKPGIQELLQPLSVNCMSVVILGSRSCLLRANPGIK